MQQSLLAWLRWREDLGARTEEAQSFHKAQAHRPHRPVRQLSPAGPRWPGTCLAALTRPTTTTTPSRGSSSPTPIDRYHDIHSFVCSQSHLYIHIVVCAYNCAYTYIVCTHLYIHSHTFWLVVLCLSLSLSVSLSLSLSVEVICTTTLFPSICLFLILGLSFLQKVCWKFLISLKAYSHKPQQSQWMVECCRKIENSYLCIDGVYCGICRQLHQVWTGLNHFLTRVFDYLTLKYNTMIRY